jgi:hypothetical protein
MLIAQRYYVCHGIPPIETAEQLGQQRSYQQE